MDLPVSGKDFVLTSSNYATMITVAKMCMRRFGNEMRQNAQDIVDHLSKNTILSSTHLDEPAELWLTDLKQHLHQFEFYGRTTTLRIFFELSSYLHTARPPIVRMNEPRYRIPVRNITFPESEENQFTRLSQKPRARVRKRCSNKNLNETNVCGQEILKTHLI